MHRARERLRHHDWPARAVHVSRNGLRLGLAITVAELDIVGVEHLLVGQRQGEAGAEAQAVLLGHLLRLVGGVHPFAGSAQAVALDGLRENNGRLAHVLDGDLVSGVDLFGIMAAALEVLQFLVAHPLDQL